MLAAIELLYAHRSACADRAIVMAAASPCRQHGQRSLRQDITQRSAVLPDQDAGASSVLRASPCKRAEFAAAFCGAHTREQA